MYLCARVCVFAWHVWVSNLGSSHFRQSTDFHPNRGGGEHDAPGGEEAEVILRAPFTISIVNVPKFDRDRRTLFLRGREQTLLRHCYVVITGYEIYICGMLRGWIKG